MKKDRAKSQWEDGSIITKAAAPIQELMNQPEVEAARKLVEEVFLMTFTIGDSGSKSLQDVKSLIVASYPVPGKDHEQVYNHPGWMQMEGNNTMWIFICCFMCRTAHKCSSKRFNRRLFGMYSVFGDVTDESGFKLCQE